jgi:PAS domain S-box-containing protein
MFCLYDAEDEFFGFTGITKDVTHEKEGFGDIEKAMHYFRYFAEKTNAVFWARNQSFDKQIYISPAYEKIWGRHRDEIYLDPSAWFDTVHPDDREEFINNDRFHEMERQGFDARFVRRYRIVLPNGEVKWIKDISFPIQNERNVFIGFAGVAEDVTKEVLHERELCEAKDRAEVANNAKSDFLAMISHEIRTPLNAILGMADILQTKGLAPDVQESVDIIASAGNDLLALVGDILDFARLEAGKLTFNQQPFDIADLFTHILQGMKYLTHGKNVALSLTVEPHMPTTVIGDQKRVRQVLVNLISNAVKFTNLGSVSVSVKCIESLNGKAIFAITVEDTGIGIEQSKLETIFEKFSQIDSIYQRKYSGIGLGLSITKELVRGMGGDISVKSEFGKGSAFKFTLNLPLQGVDERRLDLENNVAHVDSHFDMRILLVEDNHINQKIATIMLQDLGCHVEIANNGREVLDQESQLLDYDLIFMDVGLPDMSGFDIAAEIRRRPAFKELPIIAMTAHILERDREQATLAGMDGMVAKPISYERIREVLARYK